MQPQRRHRPQRRRIAAGTALLIYPLHAWDNAPSFVNAIGSTMGPIFGV